MNTIELVWSDFKTLVSTRALKIQFFEKNNHYMIYSFDTPLSFLCKLHKDGGADQIEFETSFLPTANVKLTQEDTDGAKIVRVKAAKAGWSYCACAFEFTTGQINSVIALNTDGTSKSWITNKIFDINGAEITDPLLANTAVRTQIDFEPPYDYEVIGGEMRTEPDLESDLRMFIIAVPDIPYAYGGSRVMYENLNLRYLYPGNMFQVDGRVSKFLAYNATYHTNKLRFIFLHNAGIEEKLMITIEHYKQ